MEQSLDLKPADEWFTTARFGLFMHYGLYALAGRNEWVQNREAIDAQQYRRLLDHFRADLFDAADWARRAKAAGMRYAVLTAKHHEGFCLWPSAVSDFTVAQTPAAGRDLVGEFADACRAEGLKVGLYYSLIDWHHPHFTIDGLHPDRDRPAGAPRDFALYREYLHAQVRELVTQYEPDVLWFDFSYPGDTLVPEGKGRDDWDSEKLVAMIRELKPGILLNDRLDLPEAADFITPEEYTPGSATPEKVWETCRTMNGSWGYAPGSQDWLDPLTIARILIETVARGGNLLLNIGPTGRGAIEQKAIDRLDQLANWLDLHTEAIHGASASTLVPPSGCLATEQGGRVFLHILDWPGGDLVLPGLEGKVRYANFVHDGLEIAHQDAKDLEPVVPHQYPVSAPGGVVLRLPRRRPDVLVPVIELDLDAD